MTLAKKYNNPGDLSLPVSGYHGPGICVHVHNDQHGSYGSFPTVEDGVAALQCRLSSYVARGYNSIHKMNHIYAADHHWSSNVSHLSGIDVDTRLDPTDASQMRDLIYGIVQAETGDAAYFGLNNPRHIKRKT
jgi:hypothetical protein